MGVFEALPLAVTRTVRRLRLRAANEAQVRRAALCLEDALRTASLPDGGGRLLLVRRLALGRIAADATPQTLALRIEEAVEAQGLECLHGGDTTAGEAFVVWFRDALDAHTCAALRLAQGRPLAGWYWPLALPALRTARGPPETLRALAFSLAALPEASAALPHWALALTRAGLAGVLLAALRPGDGTLLLRVCGGSSLYWRVPITQGPTHTIPPPVRSPDTAPGDPPRDDDRVVWLREMHRRVPVTQEPTHTIPPPVRSPDTAPGDPPRDDDRVVWLREMLVRTAPYLLHSVPSRLDGYIDEGRAAEPAPGSYAGQGETPSTARERGPPVLAPSSLSASAAPEEQALPGRSSTSGPRSRPERADPGQRFDATERAPAHRLTGWPHAQPTAAGGLLFLLPVLGRLGHAEWLEAHPAWARAGILSPILKLVLSRLRIAREDPAWALAVALAPPRSRAPTSFTAPAGLLSLAQTGRPWRLAATRLYDGSGRLLLAAWRRMPSRASRALLSQVPLVAASHVDGVLSDLVAEAWLTACHRWLRRVAGIGLADLVLRPAGLAATPTHIDLHFDLRATDLRVRRAGLDLDLGWVPWLGRVVAFHYVERTRP